MSFGYPRVSIDGQSLDAQVKALRAAGAEKVSRETESGAKTERAQLRRALDGLGEGDTLLVTRLNGLERSTRDLLNSFDRIAKAAAGFRSLHDAWADTTTPHGRLLLTVLGGIGEFERDLIRARTSEGRERGKKRRVHTDLPPALTPLQLNEALRELAKGTATQADSARRFNASRSTISRLAP